jgi:L-fucose isomerase-like protein
MQNNFKFTALLGVLLLINSGCAAVLVGSGAGAGTVAYVMGELKSTEEASLNKARQATQKALEDLEFVITSEKKEPYSAEFVAYETNDTKIVVKLKRLTGKFTEISIRVGLFGDESLSQLFLERVRKNLY